MSRSARKPKSRARPVSLSLAADAAERKMPNVEIVLIVMLLGFGVYHSVIYFGHQVVPNSDFPAFVKTGHQLLSFQLPSDYKRAPVVGIMQALLSSVVGGQHPDLTAGWLLNALLHPFSLVLMYLIGRRLIDRAAFWITLIAAVNPYVLQLLCEPIAETPLLFFVLITFFFIFRQSRWAYLFAALTSMVRYEGAALILAAFVMDMIHQKATRQRLYALGLSVLASVPLGLWMLGTAMQKKELADTHYLNVLVLDSKTWDTFVKFMGILWDVTLKPLLLTPAGFEGTPNESIFALSRIVAVVTFLFGAAYGLLKRQWHILALLIFLIPYLAVHSLMPRFIYPRFATPIYWLVLLVCVCGLQGIWRLINGNNRVPTVVIMILQAAVGIVALLWLVQLLGYPAKLAPFSRDSANLPYVAIGILVAAVALTTWRDGLKSLVRNLAVSVLICAMAFSNQYSVARIVGNGDRDIEFKHLADWFHENAQPGEKIVTTMPGHMHTYAPSHRQQIIPTDVIKATTSSEFVQQCRQRNVVYVAWDSRLGFATSDYYYKVFGLGNIKMLMQPQDQGPYQFVTRLDGNHPRRFINIFRLRKP